MNIKEISKQINQNAIEKGFWDDEQQNENPAAISAFMCQKILLIVSEVTEAMEADRKGRVCTANMNSINGWVYDVDFIPSFQEHVKDTLQDECADIAIRLFDFCEHYEIDLEAHIIAKLQYHTASKAR